MRHEIRLRDSLVLTSIVLIAAACISIAPAGSGALPSAASTSPGATRSLAPTQSALVVPTLPPITLLPPTPTVAPTATPTDAPTDTPTDTPTDAPTATPTDTPTDTPTGTPAERLDFTLDPTYGRVELESGFVPDPHSREMSAGGSVDASYLGNGCVGFATSAPDYSVRYTAGDRSLLRFYFLADAEGDATMIINDPQGNWLCNDDWEIGNRNPGVDINDPETGRYDIWVGTYTEGPGLPGNVFVTEVEGNHP